MIGVNKVIDYVDIIQRKNKTQFKNIDNIDKTDLINEASIVNKSNDDTDLDFNNVVRISYPSISPSPYFNTRQHLLSNVKKNSNTNDVNSLEQRIDLAMKNIDQNNQDKAKIEAINIDKYGGNIIIYLFFLIRIIINFLYMII